MAIASPAGLPADLVPQLRDVLRGLPTDWSAANGALLDRLVVACRYHGVLPLLDDASRNSGIGLPDSLSRAAHDGYLASAGGCAIWRPERRRVAAALGAAGVEAVMLKGAALAGWAYPDAALRPLGDLDVLVADDSMRAAADALAGSGYRRRVGEAEDFEHHWSLAKRIGSSTALTVELHRRVMASPPYDRLLDTCGLIARAVEPTAAPGPGGPAPATRWRVLEPLDAMLHLAAHLVLQHAGQERLIWVADIDRTARLAAVDGAFWPGLCERAGRALLARSLADGLRMSVYWFATPVPSDVLEALDESVLQEESTVYRRLRARAPVGREGARLLADVRGVASMRGKLRFALAYAFPSRAYMRSTYCPGRAWLLPLYYARRLLRGLLDVVGQATRERRPDLADPPESRMVEP